jgi:hypothetical protein
LNKQKLTSRVTHLVLFALVLSFFVTFATKMSQQSRHYRLQTPTSHLDDEWIDNTGEFLLNAESMALINKIRNELWDVIRDCMDMNIVIKSANKDGNTKLPTLSDTISTLHETVVQLHTFRPQRQRPEYTNRPWLVNPTTNSPIAGNELFPADQVEVETSDMAPCASSDALLDLNQRHNESVTSCGCGDSDEYEHSTQSDTSIGQDGHSPTTVKRFKGG